MDQTAAYVARATQVMPGGVNSGRRRVAPPLVVTEARGAYLRGADGRWLIDYYGGAATAILGHSDPRVLGGLVEAASTALLPGAGVTLHEIALAEQLVRHIPSAEQVLLCSSGSDATYYALRLARAITGRAKVMKMQGHYHGFHDAVNLNVHSSRQRLGMADPHSAGVLSSVVANTVICRYNDLADAEAKLKQAGDDIAAVIVEPVAHNGPTIHPAAGYLPGLRKLCTQYGALLVFDEIITAPRHALGGFQSLCGVVPDLTTAGKALANGWPIAVIAGPARYLERYTTAPAGDTAWAGTFNGNAGCAGAALATLGALADGAVHTRISRLGDRLRAGLEGIVAEAGVPATVTGYGSVFTLWFSERAPTDYDRVLDADTALLERYRLELRKRGVFEKPDLDGSRSVISAAHTDRDIDMTLDAAREALRAALRTAA